MADEKPADTAPPAKASKASTGTAHAADTGEGSGEVEPNYQEAKDAENEKTNKGDPEGNPLADATDESGRPIVGVSADFYRPLPTE